MAPQTWRTRDLRLLRHNYIHAITPHAHDTLTKWEPGEEEEGEENDSGGTGTSLDVAGLG